MFFEIIRKSTNSGVGLLHGAAVYGWNSSHANGVLMQQEIPHVLCHHIITSMYAVALRLDLEVFSLR